MGTLSWSTSAAGIARGWGHNPAHSPGRLRSLISTYSSTGTPLFSIIQAAGWPIWPLLLCSVVALALIIERLSSLRSSRIMPPSLLEDVLNVSAQQLPAPEQLEEVELQVPHVRLVVAHRPAPHSSCRERQ